MKRPLVLFITVIVMLLNIVPACYGQNTSRATSKANENPLSDVVVKVGYVEFPGLTYTAQDGKPAGPVNEITMKTLEHAGIRYTIASYPAARLFDDLSKGKIDLFNGMSNIPSFQNTTIHKPLNLFPLEMRVYFTGNRKLINYREDLSGQSIVLVRGYSYGEWGSWIRHKSNNVIFFETDLHDAAFTMLKKGRVDYLLTYKYIDEICLKDISIPDLHFHTPSTVRGLYCTFNLYKHKPKAELILQKLEESYLQLIKEGKLKKYR